jgi:putative DNA primase/helicase
MSQITVSKSGQRLGPSDPVTMVLARLQNVVELSSGWSALCPSHDDNNNSLSVGQGADGRVLIHCHAGCSFYEIVQAMGLRARDLFPRRRGTR